MCQSLSLLRQLDLPYSYQDKCMCQSLSLLRQLDLHSYQDKCMCQSLSLLRQLDLPSLLSRQVYVSISLTVEAARLTLTPIKTSVCVRVDTTLVLIKTECMCQSLSLLRQLDLPSLLSRQVYVSISLTVEAARLTLTPIKTSVCVNLSHC